MKEVKIWSTLKHENIMSLEGLVVIDGFPGLMSKWVVNGTVIKYITDNMDCDHVDLVSD